MTRASRIPCRRCGMSFALAAAVPGAEITRCVEAGCGRRFWHRDEVSPQAMPDQASASASASASSAAPVAVAVGVDPSWRVGSHARSRATAGPVR